MVSVFRREKEVRRELAIFVRSDTRRMRRTEAKQEQRRVSKMVAFDGE